MDFQNDPELEKLFKDELDERSRSLADGARAMASGEVTPDLAGRMLREGHTIKGTGRVMGYEGIARGGETCELVWRWVQQGELAPSSMLARTLEHLAEAIPASLTADDGQVSVAIDTVRALITDAELGDQLPDPNWADTGDEAPTTTDPEATHDVPGEDSQEADPTSQEVAETGPAEEPATTDLDASDIADVSAALDEIEREVAAAREKTSAESHESSADDAESEPTPTTTDTEDVELGSVEVVIEAIDDEESAEEHVDGASDEPVDSVVVTDEKRSEAEEPSDADEVDGLDSETAVGDTAATEQADDGSPLVFEPGPDGKLPTPEITYEIVSSAFANVPAPLGQTDAAMDPEAPGLALVDAGPSVLDPGNEAIYDLGGLLGAVETWATEESVPVNAGRLFRTINDAAALRIDLESAIAQTSQLLHSVDGGVSAAALESTLESLEGVRRASFNLQTAALGLTMMPLDPVLSTLPQLAKYLAKRIDRDVEIEIEGEQTVVDRQLVDRIGEVVRQLVVNAVAHGIEPSADRSSAGKSAHGTVKVSLSRDDQHVQIVVADDGAGVDWKAVRELATQQGLVGDDPTTDELRSVLYTNGFSTNPGASEFTGEGDGLARVTSIVEEVFGTMTLDSVAGRGTTLVVTMPAHRALQRAQIFHAGGRVWGIPESSVITVLSIPDVKISVTERGSFMSYETESLPYSSFSTIVGLDVEGMPSQVMVVQSPSGAIALAVDDVVEVSEVATKDLSPLLADSSTVVSGVALLGGDETVMLVDAGRLSEKMRDADVRSEGPVHTVLVVDDSQGVRQVVSGVLASHGFSTLVAGSVSDALAVLAKHTVDALVVDFSMPRADGVALIHMVRQRYGDIPVVMLSGVASDEDRTRAERAGVHAFFDKADFAKGALVEKLRELLDGDEATAKAEIAS